MCLVLTLWYYFSFFHLVSYLSCVETKESCYLFVLEPLLLTFFILYWLPVYFIIVLLCCHLFPLVLPFPSL